ncbi:MAG: molybdenum cofactor guanylyltransferase [Kaiparowitsia implicata GSE-PSE-MK54-09C]|jgi:molybdopterin-guanine dinucleotide biosynthesis protein A|nr:molybdenum cofactor guanylyltransferase [Kaiparowitsia implicata GSE-PSE-MK54-09C]
MTIAALVLAGGKSRRMGQDKARIELEGLSLLSRTCQIAQQVAEQVWVVAPQADRYRDLVPHPCALVEDASAKGPLVAVAQALPPLLRATHPDWALLLACDLPRLTADVVQGWAAGLGAVEAGAIAHLPHSAAGWEPLCGFYRPACLDTLLPFVADGGRSFQVWLQTQPVQPIAAVDPQVLFNCNTPADLQTLQTQ